MNHKQLETLEYSNQDEEIDLFELFATLREQRKWLVGITVIGVLLSVAVALLIPKKYVVTAQIAVPSSLDAILITNGGYISYSREKLFKEYLTAFKVPQKFNDFVERDDWLSKFYPDGAKGEEARQLNELRELLIVETVAPKTTKRSEVLPAEIVDVSLEGEDEALAVEFVNKFIEYISSDLLNKISRNGQGLVRAESQKIKKKMELLRSNIKEVSAARLAKLAEALVLAENLGVKKPDSVRLYAQEGDQGLSGLTAKSGLFLMGSGYLQGEIDAIKSRSSIDLFISEMPGLKNRLEQLSLMSFDFSGVSPFMLNQRAAMDGEAEKPKRVIIVAIGSVVAFFVAVFSALTMGAVKRRKEA